MSPDCRNVGSSDTTPRLACQESPTTLSIYAGHSAAATSSREPEPARHVGSSYIFRHPTHSPVDSPRERSWGCRMMRGTSAVTALSPHLDTGPDLHRSNRDQSHGPKVVTR